MGTTVDSLEIQLQAQAGKANNAIDTLITKLGTLNTSLTKINGSGLSGVANGVDKLSRCLNCHLNSTQAGFKQWVLQWELIQAPLKAQIHF